MSTRVGGKEAQKRLSASEALKNRLLPWTGRLKKEVKKKKLMEKKIFDPLTKKDQVFDFTMRKLEEPILKEIVSKVKAELQNETVDLSSENIRGVAAAAVGTCLRAAGCKRLNLSYNFMRDEDISLLCKNFHRREIQIEELNLSNNRIGIQGAKVLSNVLIWNRSIKKLNLDTNAISASGIETIARSLIKNQNLVSFSINWNNLDIFAEEFYYTLAGNKTLQTLKLGYCNLNDEVAEALADGLSENKTLKELFLFGNNIGDNGGLYLVEALYENKGLRYINLANNLLTDICAKSFVDLMHAKAEARLEFFANLRNNDLSLSMDKQFYQVEEMLERKRTRFVSETDVFFDAADFDKGSVDDESVISKNEPVRPSLDSEEDDQGEYSRFFNNRFYELSNVGHDPTTSDSYSPSESEEQTEQDAGSVTSHSDQQ